MYKNLTPLRGTDPRWCGFLFLKIVYIINKIQPFGLGSSDLLKRKSLLSVVHGIKIFSNHEGKFPDNFSKGFIE